MGGGNDIGEAAAPAFLLEAEKIIKKLVNVVELTKNVQETAHTFVQLPFEKLRVKAETFIPPLSYTDVNIQLPPILAEWFSDLIWVDRITRVTFKLRAEEWPCIEVILDVAGTDGVFNHTVRLQNQSSLINLLIFAFIVEELRKKGIDPLKDLEETLDRRERALAQLDTILKRLRVFIELAK